MVSINGPTRIGNAAVMPGDVVLGRNGGALFIPPQLAERVVKESERTHLEDTFGHQRLREKKYTAGQIDARWSPEIEQDFHQWLKENEDHLPRTEVYDRGDSERRNRQIRARSPWTRTSHRHVLSAAWFRLSAMLAARNPEGRREREGDFPAQALSQRQVQVVDGFVDLCGVLVAHGYAIHARSAEGEAHRLLAVARWVNAPSPTSFMLMTPMPAARASCTCATTSATFPGTFH